MCFTKCIRFLSLFFLIDVTLHYTILSVIPILWDRNERKEKKKNRVPFKYFFINDVKTRNAQDPTIVFPLFMSYEQKAHRDLLLCKNEEQ